MVRLSANRLNMEDGRIDRPIFKDLGEVVVGGVAGVEIGGITHTLDCERGNVWNITLAQSTTLTISNASPSGAAMTLTLYIKQGGIGSRTITWPSSVIWISGTTPVLSTGIGRIDTIKLQTSNGGSTWLGSVVASNISPKGMTLWTWGRNNSGQLGLNSTANGSSPIQVGTLTNWNQISAGGGTSASVKTDGTLWTWGVGTDGALGLNNTTSRSSPVQVGTQSNWGCIALSSGALSSALRTDGTLWTWGQGTNGELGSNAATSRSSPVQVGTLTNWACVSSGNAFTAAMKTDGTLWTWGVNSQGRLGLNDVNINRSSPTQVGTLTDWASVCPGTAFITALKTNGTIWVWGSGGAGRLGLNDTIDRSSPTQVGTRTDWMSIFSGRTFTTALTTDGTLWAWGDGFRGQLGDNSSTDRSSPVQVGTSNNFSRIIAALEFTAASKTDGTLWTWGRNQYGQLGSNVTINRSSPTQVGTLTNWQLLSPGSEHALGGRTQ